MPEKVIVAGDMIHVCLVVGKKGLAGVRKLVKRPGSVKQTVLNAEEKPSNIILAELPKLA